LEWVHDREIVDTQAERSEGPASQGERAHFREWLKNLPLQRLAPDLVLPSVCAEAENPAEADACYEAATKVLIQRTRDKEKYHVLFQELIDYGFRRNTWGLKMVAIGVLIASLSFAFILLTLNYRGGMLAHKRTMPSTGSSAITPMGHSLPSRR
jgi:hypothetical protein